MLACPKERAGPPRRPPPTTPKLLRWVEEIAELTTPDSVHWCDGSAEEYDRLCASWWTRAPSSGSPTPSARTPTWRARTRATWPASRTAPSSAPSSEADAGPTNNWRDPAEMREMLTDLFSGSHARPHDVRGALLDGPARLPDRPHRRPAHRLALRGGEHADHDPHGRRRARRARRGRRVRALPPFGRECRSRRASRTCRGRATPTTSTSSTSRRRREIWSYGSGYGGNALLGQEVLRAADRVGHGPRRGLAGRAHADPEGHLARGRVQAPGRGLPVGVRQDQPGDADPHPPRLEGRDHRRRHRLDEVRHGRPPLRHQPRGGLLRRGARHRREDQPERDGHGRAPTRSSPTAPAPTTATSGGRA